MKKHLLLTAALLTGLCFTGIARAEAPTGLSSPPAPAAAAASPAAVSAPASGQANRMKTCAAEYHQQNIPKSQYHSFMSTCLKKNGSAAATPATAPAAAAAPAPAASGVTKASTSAPDTTQQDKMKACSAQARSQSLTGTDRRSFMKTCLGK